jgi:predicted RNase H-like HicB family nuclease
MVDAGDDYEDAVANLRKAEQAYVTAESNLIKARRLKQDAEREYLKGLFPTPEAIQEHFK